MKRFILLTFALLGWTFWELSGGADFVPETHPGMDRIATAATPSPDPAPQPEATGESATVTRAASLPLISPRPTAPEGPAAPQPAGVTQARFLTPPDEGGPGDSDAVQWTSAADAVAEAIARETALRTGQAQPAAAPEAVPAAAPVPAGTVFVSGSMVNVRFGPGTDYGVLVSLPRGTEVDLVDVRDGWAMIRLSSGEEGWMAEYLLDGL